MHPCTCTQETESNLYTNETRGEGKKSHEKQVLVIDHQYLSLGFLLNSPMSIETHSAHVLAHIIANLGEIQS